MKARTTLGTALVLLLAGPLAMAAGNDENRPSLDQWQQRLEQVQRQQEAEALRATLIPEILESMQSADRPVDAAWTSHMETLLKRRTVAELSQARELLAQGERIPAALIGDVTQDLGFTPLDKPCRFYDSRNTVAGRLTPAGPDRSFIVRGAIPSGQGGALNCGVPLSAVAVVVNILAVSPLAQGNFQMWPTDSTPGDSVINYGGPALGINLINGVMVPVCNAFLGPCPTDLFLRTNFASSHAVVNVTGYFAPLPITPLTCTTVEASIDVTDSVFDFNSPSCPVGTTLTGGGHNWFFNTTEVWFWEVAPDGDSYRCRGRNFNPSSSEITCFARCCGVGFAL